MATAKKVQISSDELLVEMSRSISMLVNEKLSSLVDTLNEEFKRYCSKIKGVDKDFKEINEALLKLGKLTKTISAAQVEMTTTKEEFILTYNEMLTTLKEIKKEYKPIKLDVDKIQQWEDNLDNKINCLLERRKGEVEQYFLDRFGGFLKDTDDVAKKKLLAFVAEINGK